MRQANWILWTAVVFMAACTAATGGGTAVAEDATEDSQLTTDAATDAFVPVDADETADATLDVSADAATDVTVTPDVQPDVAAVSWTLFTLTQGGFCAPNSDCFSTWTVSPDGTFTAKKQGKTSSGVLSPADAQALHAAIDPLAFLEKMKNGFSCGQPPTDVGVSFSLALFGVAYDKDVTGCAYSGGADGALVQGIAAIVQAY